MTNSYVSFNINTIPVGAKVMYILIFYSKVVSGVSRTRTYRFRFSNLTNSNYMCNTPHNLLLWKPYKAEICVTRVGYLTKKIIKEGIVSNITYDITENLSCNASKYGNINLSSSIIGARIFLDDIDTGFFTPHLFKKVLRGTYKYKLIHPQYKTYENTINVCGSNTYIIVAPMLKNTENIGSLILTTFPTYSGPIKIDGVSMGTSPLTIENLSVGDHTLSISIPLFVGFSETFTLYDGEIKTKFVELIPTVTHTSPIITFLSYPSSKIYLNSIEQVGFNTPVRMNVNQGEYDIAFKLNGYNDFIIYKKYFILRPETINAGNLQPLLPDTSKTVLIFTTDDIYNKLPNEINRLCADITKDIGCKTLILKKSSWTNAAEIRGYMKSEYDKGTLKGSIFIGNFPYVKMSWDGSTSIFFENYYRDFIEKFDMVDPITGGYIYKNRSYEPMAQAFLGRIYPPDNSISLLKYYLDKNHAYRNESTPTHSGVMFYDCFSYGLSNFGYPPDETLYRNYFSIVNSSMGLPNDPLNIIFEIDPSIADTKVLNEFKNNYKVCFIHSHGTQYEFDFSENSRKTPPYKYGVITADEIISIADSPNCLVIYGTGCSQGDCTCSCKVACNGYCIANRLLFYGSLLAYPKAAMEGLMSMYEFDKYPTLSYDNKCLGELTLNYNDTWGLSFCGDPTIIIHS